MFQFRWEIHLLSKFSKAKRSYWISFGTTRSRILLLLLFKNYILHIFELYRLLWQFTFHDIFREEIYYIVIIYIEVLLDRKPANVNFLANGKKLLCENTSALFQTNNFVYGFRGLRTRKLFIYRIPGLGHTFEILNWQGNTKL